MKIVWESDDWPGAKIDPSITHLSWMPQADRPGHGLLGVGSESGAVGITLTDLLPTDDDAQRYNFNLRGHHSAICMVTWNRAQSKLASCDSSGVIYVWVRNEDRWSVELVNDRGVKVRDLSWSPCGASALICYEDNFVLIGSSTGQRVWSNPFPPTNNVNCGVWAGDSREIILAFENGRIQVLSDQGANITQRVLCDESIVKLCCSSTNKVTNKWTLAAFTSSNHLFMVSSYDQVFPHKFAVQSGTVHMEWNSDGSLLAIITEDRQLLIIDTEARLLHRERVVIGNTERPLTALTWAHEGRVLIVAAGGHLAVGRLLSGVPSLFSLVTYKVWRSMGSSSTSGRLDRLPVPAREKNAIRDLDHHIIRCRIPRQEDLCQFVCTVSDARSYCTIRPMSRGGQSYVLCMEHMGGLVPLLVGRQVNRFLPQFHVSLHPGSSNRTHVRHPHGSSAQVEDVSVIPRTSTGRNSLWRRSKRQIRALMSRHVRPPRQDLRLAHVSSNVWCTRFNVSSMAPQYLPEFLAQIVYKTSVLHLQPRQMTVELTDLSAPGAAPRLTNRQRSLGDDLETDLSLLLAATAKIANNKDGAGEEGLTNEERLFFDRILTECAHLRSAMEMAGTSVSSSTANTTLSSGASSVAAEKTTQVPHPQPGPSGLAGTAAVASQSSSNFMSFLSGGGGAVGAFTGAAGGSASVSAGPSHPTSPTLSHGENVSMTTSSVASWLDEVDQMEYIDGADEQTALLHAVSEQKRDRVRETQRERDTDDIRRHVDGLSQIAEYLRQRHSDFSTKRDRGTIIKMRAQMKELLKKVNEIEKKVGSGDVRIEVRQLQRTIEEMKRALGEGEQLTKCAARDALTMHNKTPFWNEHNQVYQLDFGGRVTQESAKNFQIEVDNKQVLQFGRIESGAYTLDFRKPFCAAQAFAVALASITQRLK